ncbi:hypothetical protein A2974_02510 [Candidatus Peregrinibacteria bacterium RIFCSPLOWO2_01_FULL_48_20]|nr:MAG: hypothetical protein A2974_02510 [Candidatus Peregrinibacteria bacterium RIFCSPLOWO2_01_FULL_48_20]
MKKLFFFILGLLTVGLFLVDFTPSYWGSELYNEVEGKVIQNDETSVLLLTKDGEEIEISKDRSTIVDQDFEVGDRLVVQDWGEVGISSYTLADYVRRPAVYILFALFIGTVILVTGWQGLRSLLGLVFSFVILFKLLFPLMLLGWDPLWTAIFGSLLMIPAMFYLSHGFNRKTSAAVLGTFFALVVSGVLAGIFADLAHLSGLADDSAAFLNAQFGDLIDFQKLLLAGILISMLGVLDDVSISQASIVHELKSNKKNISFWDLYTRAMSVGKDHIGSMVNTLVLVFAGASLPMLLIFLIDGYGMNSVLNYEFVAEEMVQTFAASIGLILTVPITTFFASLQKSP